MPANSNLDKMDNIEKTIAGEFNPVNPEQLQQVEGEAAKENKLAEAPSQRFNPNPDYQTTGEILTIEEIRSRYPREWVLLAIAETDEEWYIYRGEVLAHSSNRNEIDEQLSPAFQRVKSIAIEYTGPLPEDYALLL